MNKLHDLSDKNFKERIKIYKEILVCRNNLKDYLHDMSYKGYKENIIIYQDNIINGGYMLPEQNEGKQLTYFGKYRPIENLNAKKTILIFGCSFAYGLFLENNETFSHQLGKFTGYRVYNRAHNGRGAQQMLYQLENNDFIKSMPKPDYIIYVFIPHHIRRSWLTCAGAHKFLYYKKTKNKLVIDTPSVEKYITGFFETILNQIYGSKYLFDYKKGETEFYFEHITQSLDDIRKIWGNDVKFIFFAYENFYNDELYLEKLKELENKGVICIRLSDLSNKNYIDDIDYRISEYDYHPNAKAWEEITPLFVNYLQKMGYLK